MAFKALCLAPDRPGLALGAAEDLGTETTFYCPCEYSTAVAKTHYHRLPRMAADGSECICTCAYLSEDGDCGVCR